MDTAKTKKGFQSLRLYWYFFIPLTILLALMIYFPLRTALDELLYDTIFYSVIMLICIISAIRVYLRFRKRGRRLVAIILLCVLLSGWQVFDLTVLRYGHSFPLPGYIYYTVRFPDKTILCHNITERYVSNTFITVAYDINREASWFACGG